MDRGTWQATIHGTVNSQTQLSNYHFHFSSLTIICLALQYQVMKLENVPVTTGNT